MFVCACLFSDPGKLEAMFRTALNEDQRAAVRKLVTAKDYALLLGMPGTGEWCHVHRHRHSALPFPHGNTTSSSTSRPVVYHTVVHKVDLFLLRVRSARCVAEPALRLFVCLFVSSF